MTKHKKITTTLIKMKTKKTKKDKNTQQNY